MKSYIKEISLIVLLLCCQISIGQIKEGEKKGHIGTEVVNVVKPYTPTISDAFKEKEVPQLNSEENAKKESVQYSILPFPVASTFAPAKGQAQAVDKAKQDKIFKNSASLGLGNFGRLNAELYVNEDVSSSDYVGGMLRHRSSQGGIPDVVLNDSFYDTKVDAFYGSHAQELSWRVDLGFQNQIYNWYGLPVGFASSLPADQASALIAGINPEHSFNTLNLGGTLNMEEGALEDIKLKFTHFSDSYSSTENRFFAAPSFKFAVLEEAVKAKVYVDYLDGSFKNDYFATNAAALNYGFTNFGITPSFVMKRADWTIDLGAQLVYSMGKENSENKFYAYPAITASYNVVGDLMVFYAAAKGGLQQNNYKEIVDQNPYVSPTLLMKPTNEVIDLNIGLMGKLASTVSYNVKASLIQDKNKALFKANDYTEAPTNANYAFGNSFKLVYDEVDIMRFNGEIRADLAKGLSLEADATLSTFTTKVQEEAWNLPAIELNTKLDFVITDKWRSGLHMFYVGERKDMQINSSSISNSIPAKAVSLDGYFDLNANLRYLHNDRFTAFLQFNNVLNNEYQKWLNYPVQGFQFVLGANVNFDF